MEFCEGIMKVYKRGWFIISYKEEEVRKVNSIFSRENDIELVYIIALCIVVYTYKENIA
jgi:hypothetical protein